MRSTCFALLLLGLLFQNCNQKVGVSRGNPIGDAVHLELTGPTEYVYWIHAPMHPGNNKAITFSTQVSDPEGIKKVELFLKEYELYKKDGLPAKQKRVGGVWGAVKEWKFDAGAFEAKLDFEYKPGFGAATNVVYVFRTTNNRGEVTDRMAQFDAGKSPWPTDKILLYSTNVRPMRNNINLCFVPDVDYHNDRRNFLRDARELVFNGFLKNNMIGYKGIDKWQFYYTNQPVNGKVLVENYGEASYFPEFLLEDSIEGIDAFGLLHKTDFTDRALPIESVWFLANNFFTTEAHNFGTAIHEAAHAIFKLSDEYDDCVCFEVSGKGNVFSKKRDCENAKPAGRRCRPLETNRGETWYTYEDEPIFLTRQSCELYNQRIGIEDEECVVWYEDGKQFFMSEPATCVMWDDGDELVRNFMPACAKIIQNYYDQLDNGGIAAAPAAPSTEEALSERNPNIFGYERVVRLAVINEDVEWNISVEDVRYGVPDKDIVQGRDVDIDIRNQDGSSNYSLSIDYPQYVHFHAKNENFDSLRQGENAGLTFLNVPYSDSIANIVLNRKTRVRRAGLQSYATEETQQFFSVGEQLKRATQEFEEGQ